MPRATFGFKERVSHRAERMRRLSHSLYTRSHRRLEVDEAICALILESSLGKDAGNVVIRSWYLMVISMSWICPLPFISFIYNAEKDFCHAGYLDLNKCSHRSHYSTRAGSIDEARTCSLSRHRVLCDDSSGAVGHYSAANAATHIRLLAVDSPRA